MRIRNFLLDLPKAVWISVILYCVYASFFLLQNTFATLSLIDDGQTLLNTLSLQECFTTGRCTSSFTVFFESNFGRFRPVYWLIQYVLYSFFASTPSVLHEVRIYLLGSCIVALSSFIIYRISRSTLAAIFGSLVFFNSYTFTENMVRLGPVEPYQLIFVCISIFLFLNLYEKKQWLSSSSQYLLQLTLIALFAIKETSVVLLPIFVVTTFLFKKQHTLKQILVSIVPFCILSVGLFISKSGHTETNYVENYQVTFSLIKLNIHYYLNLLKVVFSPYFFPFLLLAPISFYLLVKREVKKAAEMFIWFAVLISFIVALLPWKFVLERYLFIPTFAFTIVFASSIGVIESLFSFHYQGRTKWIGYILGILILSNTFFLYIPVHFSKSFNYINWYATYLKFEDTLVTVIAEQKEPVYLNAIDTLDNWEVLYEIPIHIQLIKKTDTNIRLLTSDSLNKGILILDTSSLIPSVNPQEYRDSSEIIAEGKYTVEQIHPDEFKARFQKNPLGVFYELPKGQEIAHYWKIQRIK